MKKRKWMYIQKPHRYEIHCDKCGGHMITWSEYEHMIFCYQCRIDTPGTGGIFDGPIPLEVSKIFGINFDRVYLRDKTLRKMKVVGNKLVWRKLNAKSKQK